jgi:hypothetical protein
VLRLSPDLTVPVEYTTEASAILGRRGSGKTNTAVVAVEELLDASQQVCVVDTVGVWWGLRSNVDGSPGKYDVIIFGGEHGDVPLEEGAGKVIAAAIVEHRISAVIDTSSLSKAGARRFLYDFVTEVYHRKGSQRVPLHMVFDEADELAPQNTGVEASKLLSAMQDLVRRGRSRGIGVTLVTQRPAVLNKDVLTQVEVLIAMQMTGPRDVAAIGEWVKLNADDATYQEVRGSLASLKAGEGWLWSPSWLQTLKRVRFRKRTTFDSSVTPKIGEVVLTAEAKPIDLARLGEAIAATVERAKADDPKELRRQLADAQRELEAADNTIRHLENEDRMRVVEPTIVEVPTMDAETLRAIEKAVQEAGEQVNMALRAWSDQWGTIVADAMRQVVAAVVKAENLTAPERAVHAVVTPIHPDPGPAHPARQVRKQQHVVHAVPEIRDGGEPYRPVAIPTELQKTHRVILTVLVNSRRQLSWQQVAMLTGYAPKGGGFNNAMSRLRKLGYITEGRDAIQITQAGIDSGAFEDIPQGRALVEAWLNKFGGMARAIFEHLLEYPEGRMKSSIAESLGYAVGGGGFSNALSKLKSTGLIEKDGDMFVIDASLAEEYRR